MRTLTWMLALAVATLGTAFIPTFVVYAQNPMTLRWDKAAPFPEPEEELYGITAGGKMYVIGGFSENGKPAPAMVYEYDAAGDTWTKKKPIPVPVHHQAQAELNGKIYIFGGCQRPLTGAGAGGWQPVDNSWEYDPKADSWRALAPMPIKRCSALAEQVNGKFYVIGGGTIQDNSGEAALFGDRPQRMLATNQMYDPATNTWTNKSPMNVARNHAFGGVVNGKIYVIGGRIGAVHVTASSNTDVVEEYDPAKDLWSRVKSRMPTPRSGGGWATYNGRVYIAGGEGQHERGNYSFRAVEAYEPATDRWIIFPSMPTARHGAAGAFIGNKFHLVSGKPEGGGLPDLAFKGLPAHDVLEIPAGLSTN